MNYCIEMNTNSKYIIDNIIAIQNPAKASWLEKYVKHDIKAYGVGNPQIRELVKKAESALHLSSLTITNRLNF